MEFFNLAKSLAAVCDLCHWLTKLLELAIYVFILKGFFSFNLFFSLSIAILHDIAVYMQEVSLIIDCRTATRHCAIMPHGHRIIINIVEWKRTNFLHLKWIYGDLIIIIMYIRVHCTREWHAQQRAIFFLWFLNAFFALALLSVTRICWGEWRFLILLVSLIHFKFSFNEYLMWIMHNYFNVFDIAV